MRKRPDMDLKTKLKCKMLALRCPGFWKNMPEQDDDVWYFAKAYRTTIASDRCVYKEKVKGAVKAYVRARELALRLDDESPLYFGDWSVGIRWGVDPCKPTHGMRVREQS